VDGMVMEIWIPVAVPYVEVTCHDDGVIQVDNVLTEELKSSLVAIGVDINYEVDVLFIVEG